MQNSTYIGGYWKCEMAGNTILRLPQVKTRTGLSRSCIYMRIAAGSFPRSIRLGARAVGWIEADIDTWIAQQIDANRVVKQQSTVPNAL